MPPPAINMSEFRYTLPPERIAAFPLAERDASRLLVCDAESGAIGHRTFHDLPTLIPDDALLVLNDTRVVRARLLMRKETGARVEVLLLEPVTPSNDPAVAMAARGEATWLCMIGGARRARGGRPLLLPLGDAGAVLAAVVVAPEEDAFLVRLQWPHGLSFAEVLERGGHVPLPPYIRRESTERDVETYQTVYAVEQGSVAAPTAGLHFTPRVLEAMRARGISMARVTLHVGAGTFRPVQTERADEHTMHLERISVSLHTVEALLAQARRRERTGRAPIVVVGTTSLRTVESLYWFGVKLGEGGIAGDELDVDQWDPYRLVSESTRMPTLEESLERVIAWARERGLPAVTGGTRIMIIPGYRFAACDALITNFHQPESTLLLLVGALLGRSLWRRVYEQALDSGYRFLSYGDSSLLIHEPGRFRSPSS